MSSFAGKVVAGFNCLIGRKNKKAEFIAKLSFGAYNKKCPEGTTFISSIKEECDKYDSFPDCNYTLSYNFYRSFFKNLAKNYKKKYYKNINADNPILIVSGQDDPVGGYGKLVDKLYDFYKHKVGVERVEKVLYPGVRHELLNDTSREDAYKKIGDFISAAFDAEKRKSDELR